MALKFAVLDSFRPSLSPKCQSSSQDIDIGWELVPNVNESRFPNVFFAAFGSEQLLVLLKALIEVSCTCVEDIVKHMSKHRQCCSEVLAGDGHGYQVRRLSVAVLLF